jgi:hypothetical protein
MPGVSHQVPKKTNSDTGDTSPNGANLVLVTDSRTVRTAAQQRDGASSWDRTRCPTRQLPRASFGSGRQSLEFSPARHFAEHNPAIAESGFFADENAPTAAEAR